jgi:hypothetical protein
MSPLLPDFVSIGTFASNLGKTPNAVYRWMAARDGLPFVKLGGQRLIHLPTASTWLMQRMQRRNPDRRRLHRR